MRHGGAAALRRDDLKRQILVHGTPPFRDLLEILNDNGGQYQRVQIIPCFYFFYYHLFLLKFQLFFHIYLKLYL